MYGDTQIDAFNPRNKEKGHVYKTKVRFKQSKESISSGKDLHVNYIEYFCSCNHASNVVEFDQMMLGKPSLQSFSKCTSSTKCQVRFILCFLMKFIKYASPRYLTIYIGAMDQEVQVENY